MKYYALIVAGGSGLRMQSDIPKQFLLISGKPVLMHTIEAFYYSELKPEIIVVLNSEYHNQWRELCLQYNFDIPYQLVKAGKERFYSVKNGLEQLDETGAIVAIHDAVRPIVSNGLITNSFIEAGKKGSVVCGVPSKDSVRLVTENRSQGLRRDCIYLVQTPQTFLVEILKEAYKQEFSSDFTDDASVVEKAKFPVYIIAGESSNIKITYPEDLAIAELLKKQNPA